MIKYKVFLNNGYEALGVDQKTITANEEVQTCDENALAREICHENPLIPEQVAKAVLENFCKAAAQLMSMGFAIQLKNGKDVALRMYPDIHVKGGNINLERARQLDPTVTELTVENAGDLVSKAGITVRVRAESCRKFTEILQSMDASVQRTGTEEREKVLMGDDDDDNNGGGNSGGGNNPGGGDTPGGF